MLKVRSFNCIFLKIFNWKKYTYLPKKDSLENMLGYFSVGWMAKLCNNSGVNKLCQNLITQLSHISKSSSITIFLKNLLTSWVSIWYVQPNLWNFNHIYELFFPFFIHYTSILIFPFKGSLFFLFPKWFFL